MDDVSITGLDNAETLKWNSSTLLWEPGTAGGAESDPTFATWLSDTAGDIVTHNASEFLTDPTAFVANAPPAPASGSLTVGGAGNYGLGAYKTSVWAYAGTPKRYSATPLTFTLTQTENLKTHVHSWTAVTGATGYVVKTGFADDSFVWWEDVGNVLTVTESGNWGVTPINVSRKTDESDPTHAEWLLTPVFDNGLGRTVKINDSQSGYNIEWSNGTSTGGINGGNIYADTAYYGPSNNLLANWDTNNSRFILYGDGSNLVSLPAVPTDSGAIYTDGSGNLTAVSFATSTGDSTDWNTAYGWGDHSSAGYLKLDSVTYTFDSNQNQGTTIQITSDYYTFSPVVVSSDVNQHNIVLLGKSNGPDQINASGFTLSYTGAVTALSYSVTNGNSNTQWDTAYGWGDHSQAGYAAGDHNHGGYTGDTSVYNGSSTDTYHWSNGILTGIN
jgi:hypothetical protein